MLDYLTSLPVELICKILENVPSFDILSSVCFVNKRLRSISLSYPRLQVNFSCMDRSMKKNQFDTICSQLVYSTSQVTSLTLFNENDLMTSVKNALFFSRFIIIDKTFSNLRSLTLTSIKYDTWCLFKSRFPPLIMMLSIYLNPPDTLACLSMTSGALTELIFLSASLQRLSVKMGDLMISDVKIDPPKPGMSSSIQYLHIENVIIDLLSLLAVTPMLHTLEGYFDIQDWQLAKIHPRLFYLQQLRIELWETTLIQMSILLSSFPRLIYLVIIAYDVNSDMANGFQWARLLQEIKDFEFKFEFSYDAFVEEPFNLDSFRTKFWLEEKNWFVTYHRNSNPDDYSILYSTSSSIIDYPPHEINGTLISQSTTSEPESFSCVHRLTINDHYLKYSHLNRYKHINELDLLEVTATYPTTFKDIMSCIDTSQILKCTISSVWSRKSSFECIEFLLSLPRLHRLEVSLINLSYFFRHQWFNIIDLKIEHDFESRVHILSSNDINALYHSFPHIERLDIHSSSIIDLPQLLNGIKMTLKDIIIRQPCELTNQQFLTHQWIQQNTEFKHFHYASTSNFGNSIRLWL